MNKKKLEVKSEPVRCDKLEWPPNFNFKEGFKTLIKKLQKEAFEKEPYWLPKEKEKMKKTKWTSIDIKQEVYNKLESYRTEWSADNLSDVINNFILYYEADQEPEDDRYYCENCGDYHD